MDRVIRTIWWVLTGLFTVTAVVTIYGIIYLWFVNPEAKLPYLSVLFTKLIIEGVALVFLLIKRSMNYIPKVKTFKNEEELNKFLRSFIERGSSVEIVSNRVGWLSSDEECRKVLMQKAEKGCNVNIHTARKPDCIESMKESKINFMYGLPMDYTPNARFTLINSTRQGAEELAIAVGSFPGHEVFIFDYKTSPQIIGLTKDITKLMRYVKKDGANE